MTTEYRVHGATFRYTHTIGRGEEAGTGFKNPVAVAIGADDVMYVVSRSYDYRADAKRITVCTVRDQDYIGEIGNAGRLGGDMMDPGESDIDGSLIWPTAIDLDSNGNLYVTDEWLNRVAIFSSDGDWLGSWGSNGSGEGQFDKPSGLAIDSEDNLFIVDTGNDRIQKYSKDGEMLAQWGEHGSGEGQFDMPWGITIDSQGDIYVADWRNDRIQKFDSSGNFISSLGTTGYKEGEFNRPTDIAVDKEGLQYVADWDNDRVQIFDQHGDFITMLTGDATLSKWAETKLDANPDMRLQREIAQGLERERLFRGPIGIEVDNENRLFVVDSQRNRVQIYRKIDPTFVGLYDGGRL